MSRLFELAVMAFLFAYASLLLAWVHFKTWNWEIMFSLFKEIYKEEHRLFLLWAAHNIYGVGALAIFAMFIGMMASESRGLRKLAVVLGAVMGFSILAELSPYLDLPVEVAKGGLRTLLGLGFGSPGRAVFAITALGLLAYGVGWLPTAQFKALWQAWGNTARTPGPALVNGVAPWGLTAWLRQWALQQEAKRLATQHAAVTAAAQAAATPAPVPAPVVVPPPASVPVPVVVPAAATAAPNLQASTIGPIEAETFTAGPDLKKVITSTVAAEKRRVAKAPNPWGDMDSWSAFMVASLQRKSALKLKINSESVTFQESIPLQKTIDDLWPDMPRFEPVRKAKAKAKAAPTPIPSAPAPAATVTLEDAIKRIAGSNQKLLRSGLVSLQAALVDLPPAFASLASAGAPAKPWPTPKGVAEGYKGMTPQAKVNLVGGLKALKGKGATLPAEYEALTV